MYETYMGWLVGEVGKQRVLNTKSLFPFADPLINSPLSSGRVCHRCAAFLVFEAVPNRPSYMDTGQCPRNGFSRALVSINTGRLQGADLPLTRDLAILKLWNVATACRAILGPSQMRSFAERDESH